MALPRQKRRYCKSFTVTGEDGVVRKFYLGKPVAYKVFRLWPDDIKAMYIQDIVNKYPGITARNIAIMLDCSAITVQQLSRKLGNIIPKFNRHDNGNSHDAIVNQFYSYFNCEKKADICRQNAMKKKSSNGIEVKDYTMTVSFNIDTDNIVDYLKSIGFSGEVTLTIKRNVSKK